MSNPINLIFITLIFVVLSINCQIVELSDYEYPMPSSSAQYETIAIIGTNDIHGRVIPSPEIYAGANKSAKTGGLTLLSSYLDILSSQWGNKLLWLDGGDQFQGSLESNLFKGKPLVDFFNYKNKIQKAAAIGNHEFDFGLNELENRMRESRFQRFAANIFDRSTDKIHNFPNTASSGIYKVGRIKVGVIGLTTIQTPYTTATNVSAFEFKNYTDIVIQESKKMRKFGANIIVLTSHVGNPCTSGDFKDLVTLKIRDFTTIQNTTCTPNEEIYNLLNSIPEGTLDAVVGGHYHLISHHFINGIPLVMGENFGRHINVLYLTFDLAKGKLMKENTRIEGPIPICDSVPENEKTCYAKNMKSKVTSNTNLARVSFHGKLVSEDQTARDVLSTYIDEANKYSGKVLGTVSNQMMINSEDECELGNFVTDALKWETQSDFVIYNKGGIRQSWQFTGDLTYSMLFQTIPFDSFVYKFEALGKEVLEIMTVLQGGAKGFYQTAGLQQEVCVSPIHKLINVKLVNGDNIDPDKVYTISTVDFLINGGDDFAKVLKIFKPKNPVAFDEVKEIIKKYLNKFPVLNSNENPSIDQTHRRLIVKKDCS